MSETKKDLKGEILKVLRRFPDEALTVPEIAKYAKQLGIWIPYDHSTHLSQMLKKEMVLRPSRGKYQVNPEYERLLSPEPIQHGEPQSKLF